MKVVMMVLAVTAWFTDAALDDSYQAPKPRVALPEVAGTFGKGVLLTKAVPVEHPELSQTRGYISFWIQPRWDGNDGKTHRILRIGDPGRNGLLVEKSALGMLRFVMASPKKISAARTDVSAWKAGEWHHVAVAWLDLEGKPLGMLLVVDRKAVDGPVTADNAFLDPNAMDDKRVWIGDASSEAAMDELIMRSVLKTKLALDPLEMAYRDYFRTAPYTAIRIDPEPHRVAADRRVVEGFKKQFGLEGKLASRVEDMTDFVAGFHQWGAFDAKPFITWRTSDEKIATVNTNGLVTGVRVGRCTLMAEYRGMMAQYDLEVVPVKQPDLDLTFVERLPRYDQNHLKNNPEPGDKVSSVAHIHNMGYKSVPAGTVVALELFPDANRNFLVDRDEVKQAVVQTQRIGELAPMEEATASFSWVWPKVPVWVRVTVDPRNEVKELCEANNRRCALNIARPLLWGHRPEVTKKFHDEKTVNLVGSFSAYDWYGAMIERLELLLRDAVYPSTSPYGVRDSVRLDMIMWRGDITPGRGEFKDVEPKEAYAGKYWDGGWPQAPIRYPMTLDAGIMHEMGHVALCLPDLYGYFMYEDRVYLKDEKGEYYEGGELLPYISSGAKPWRLPRPPADGLVPCTTSYPPLMTYMRLWLCESNAGKIDHYRGLRGFNRLFWGVQGRLIPTWENTLLVTDVYDRPLAGAAVYVYQVEQSPSGYASAKYFYDRPKFMGNTDEDGRWMFPSKTDKDWDDPLTDEVEHGIPVWNPFGRVQRGGAKIADIAFTPSVWETQGLLLIKVVSGTQTEFFWMTLGEFNTAYFRDNRRGFYPIRTSLQPCEGVMPLVRPEIPEAIREQNLAPVAVVEPTELTVEVGQEFTLDGSKSYDPEGQPLIYAQWWKRTGKLRPAYPSGFTHTWKAPNEPGWIVLVFYVNDGLRTGRAVIKIKVVEAGEE